MSAPDEAPPPRFVGRHQMRRRSPPRLVLEIDVRERVAVSVQVCPSFMSGSSTDHGGGKRRSGHRKTNIPKAKARNRIAAAERMAASMSRPWR